MISTDELQGLPPAAQAEILSLRGAKAGLEIDKRILELKVQKYERMLWARKSERLAPADQKQGTLFDDPAGAAPAPIPPVLKADTKDRAPRLPKGPKPLDPALPREVIAVASPALKELICPETNRPMQPGFVETLEVLARRAPEYYVKRYERTVFVSPAKTAPVYTPWPADVLPRSRMHVSIVAYLASAHYCEHQPFHRIEQDLARKGVHLPRNSQVSLMQQLDRLMEPLLSALKQEVFASGHIHLDCQGGLKCGHGGAVQKRPPRQPWREPRILLEEHFSRPILYTVPLEMHLAILLQPASCDLRRIDVHGSIREDAVIVGFLPALPLHHSHAPRHAGQTQGLLRRHHYRFRGGRRPGGLYPDA